MTDRTERAVQRIALQRNGHGKTIDDVFALVIALADDTDEQHDEAVSEAKAARAAADAAKAQVAEVAAKLDAHLEEAVDRDHAIADLALKYDEHLNVFTPPIVARLIRLEDASNSCPAVVQAAIETEHAARHADHMATFHKPRREDDDPAEDHRSERSGAALMVAGVTDRRVWVMWGVGLFVAASAASAVIRWGVSALLAHIH